MQTHTHCSALFFRSAGKIIALAGWWWFFFAGFAEASFLQSDLLFYPPARRFTFARARVKS